MTKNATKGARKTSSEAPSVEVLGKGRQLTVVVTRLGLLALQGMLRHDENDRHAHIAERRHDEEPPTGLVTTHRIRATGAGP